MFTKSEGIIMKNRCVKKIMLVLVIASMLLFTACYNHDINKHSEVKNDLKYLTNFGYISEKDDSVYFVDDLQFIEIIFIRSDLIEM